VQETRVNREIGSLNCHYRIWLFRYRRHGSSYVSAGLLTAWRQRHRSGVLYFYDNTTDQKRANYARKYRSVRKDLRGTSSPRSDTTRGPFGPNFISCSRAEQRRLLPTIIYYCRRNIYRFCYQFVRARPEGAGIFGRHCGQITGAFGRCGGRATRVGILL
jgi:hypothetical protein